MPAKRKKLRDHFDNPRQVSEPSAHTPGDIENMLHRDRLAAERQERLSAQTQRQKRVLDFIRKHPGLTKNGIRERIGSVAGIDGWLRNGVLVERGFGLHVA